MIVFSGKVSDKIQLKTLKKKDSEFYKIAWTVCTVLIVISGLLWFFLEGEMKLWLMLSCLLVGALLFSQIFNLNNKLPLRWEFVISIDKEKITVESPLFSNPLRKSLDKINKVIDDGDCFYLIYSDMNNCIICQKNLITQGSLDEFENIFKDKMTKYPQEKS